MKLYDLLDEGDLDQAIREKLVNVRDSGDGHRIYNYSDSAIYTPGAWDSPAVRQCRGLIVDEQDLIIARPWGKFFNHGQVEAGELDMAALVEVTDKMDGSLGIVHRDAGGSLRVATRGSFISDQAVHATRVLNERYGHIQPPASLTILVEIIYPGNRIVCNYGEQDDLVLLGGVDIGSGDYFGPGETGEAVGWTGPITTVFSFPTLAAALEAKPRAGAEGMCIRYVDESRIVKVKQEDYVRLHRLVTGMSERVIWQSLLDGQSLTDLLSGVPDELHGWIKGTWTEMLDRAQSIQRNAQNQHRTIVAELGEDLSRKDYAQQASRSDVRPYLFMLLDGKDPMPAVLKSIKPVGDTRFKVYTEDVA